MSAAEARSEVIDMLGLLSEESLNSAMDYIAWLRHLEEAEDQDDTACYLERRDEPEITLEELKQKLRQNSDVTV